MRQPDACMYMLYISWWIANLCSCTAHTCMHHSALPIQYSRDATTRRTPNSNAHANQLRRHSPHILVLFVLDCVFLWMYYIRSRDRLVILSLDVWVRCAAAVRIVAAAIRLHCRKLCSNRIELEISVCTSLEKLIARPITIKKKRKTSTGHVSTYTIFAFCHLPFAIWHE